MALLRTWKEGKRGEIVDAVARVHRYPDAKAKLVFEIDYNLACQIVNSVVGPDAERLVQISIVDQGGNAVPIDVRADTFDAAGTSIVSKPNQPGVCVLSKMRWRT
ncbi:hypothetical protein GCM10007927_34960 [Sulfitobacter pacificus]|uniref:Uncharacterized protein n=1 Tax=Sulfitobacter pacificus TaxID=1499314 RepID=A0ABQ5VND3_9RHOB|nr:hypothetical protein GCM10007927_34960 [Sulfitobacter pacificus]